MVPIDVWGYDREFCSSSSSSSLRERRQDKDGKYVWYELKHEVVAT